MQQKFQIPNAGLVSAEVPDDATDEELSQVGQHLAKQYALASMPEPPAPEGALGSFFRPIASNLFPSLATAAGGIAGAFLGGGAGTVAEPGAGTIAGGIAGDIALGTAAGAGAEAYQTSILGEDTVKAMQAQEAANLAAHPFWAKMGTLIGQVPSMLGGGAGFAKVAVRKVGLLGRLGDAAAQGARMSGSEAAQQKVSGAPGSEDISIPEEIIKGALTVGPTGFLGPARTLLGSIGLKAPTDAAIMATSGALYDKVVHGKPIDPTALGQQVGADIPGFMVLNALTHGIGGRHLPEVHGDATGLEPALDVKAPENSFNTEEEAHIAAQNQEHEQLADLVTNNALAKEQDATVPELAAAGAPETAAALADTKEVVRDADFAEGLQTSAQEQAQVDHDAQQAAIEQKQKEDEQAAASAAKEAEAKAGAAPKPVEQPAAEEVSQPTAKAGTEPKPVAGDLADLTEQLKTAEAHKSTVDSFDTSKGTKDLAQKAVDDLKSQISAKVEPKAPEKPANDTTKFTDYGKDGKLSEEVELPHKDAIDKLTLRHELLKTLKACLEA